MVTYSGKNFAFGVLGTAIMGPCRGALAVKGAATGERHMVNLREPQPDVAGVLVEVCCRLQVTLSKHKIVCC